MSCTVKGTTISLTRGDTCIVQIVVKDDKDADYVPTAGDNIRFACKKTYNDDEVLIMKDIPTDTLILKIDPEDTKDLVFGDYVYDIQLTKANGDVDTFITTSKLILTQEVD